MSISVWCEIVCDQCSDTAPGLFADKAIPKRELIERAKKQRWIVRRDEVFCSRRCEIAYAENLALQSPPAKVEG